MPVQVSICRPQAWEVALGPLVGLLISRAKLAAVLAGLVDTVYCRYAAYAREAGAILCFFTVDGLDPAGASVRGYQLHPGAGGAWDWVETDFPLPRVVYDRCFGKEGRAEAARLRELAPTLGMAVVNHMVKITKLQAFTVLTKYSELARHLPFTAPLTPETLAGALEAHDDLYLKPDALYKGMGVYRLTRQAGDWLLGSRADGGTEHRLLPDREALMKTLGTLLAPGTNYLIQEGLPLATYLGNRFDFRSLVQKDGLGDWTVTGIVARIAPDGSPITSPRSGGCTAPAARVLQHAFPDRWKAVLTDLERVSVDLARRVDRQLGPCAELGLDLGVVADGTVRLVEVNGKPLKVSLQRLNDPLVTERIYRYPIHFACYLDISGLLEVA